MRYFLDTEFIEKPNTIQLVSVGLKCEDGRKYYAISSEFDPSMADDWVKKNVLDILEADIPRKSIATIRQELLEFIGQPLVEGTDIPEFWAYFCNYDWVVFCWIFGKMIDLPRGWPMFCNDLKPLLDNSGKPHPGEPQGLHNALEDAEWNEMLYNYIMDDTPKMGPLEIENVLLDTTVVGRGRLIMVDERKYPVTMGQTIIYDTNFFRIRGIERRGNSPEIALLIQGLSK